MNIKDAIKKIKKCLALAGSSNPHEAAAAIRQAEALMREFSVTDQDVSLASVSESEAVGKTVPLVKWECMLSALVARAFGCEIFTKKHYRLRYGAPYKRERLFIFVGVGAASEVAAYAYDVLSSQCAKGRRAHIALQPKSCKPKTKTARGDLFAEGWCAGVHDKLMAFAATEKDIALIEKYMQSRYPDMQASKAQSRVTGKNVRQSDFSRGVEACEAASLERGVGTAAPLVLLGAAV